MCIYVYMKPFTKYNPSWHMNPTCWSGGGRNWCIDESQLGRQILLDAAEPTEPWPFGVVCKSGFPTCYCLLVMSIKFTEVNPGKTKLSP